MLLGELILNYINEHKTNYRDFGAKCGISAGYISMLVNNKNPRTGKPLVPSIARYASIARGMGLTLDELFAKIDDAPVALGFSPKTPLLHGEFLGELSTKRIPIIGDTAAGNPIIANREYDEYIDVPIDGRKYDAAVRVTGDSMEPGYHIGDLALIRYQEDVLDGQIAVVCIDDTVTLKRVYHGKEGIVLISDNPKYAPMPVSASEIDSIHLTGRAIGVIHWED